MSKINNYITFVTTISHEHDDINGHDDPWLQISESLNMLMREKTALEYM
jgi:hypothetical protein